jgi:hypothetical protein
VGRDIRYLPYPGCVVEITSVTFQNRKLLAPSPEVNQVILGVMGRGLSLYPDVGLIAYQVLSTHATLSFAPADHLVLSKFMEFFGTNISKEVGTYLRDWPGHFWHRRYKPITVIDDHAQVTRLKYLLANGVKENLVEKVADWPGVSCIDSLLTGKPATGVWYDRTALYYARRRNDGQDVDPEDFAEVYQVPLVPLPCWAHLPPEEYQQRIGQLVIEIEEEAANKREREGKTVLGVEAIENADPHERPETVKKSPAPVCHASTRRAYLDYRELLSAIIEAYDEASKAFRSGEFNVIFPLGTFRPLGGFVGATSAVGVVEGPVPI